MSAPFALFHRADRPGVRGATGRPTRYYFDRCTYQAFGEAERWETWQEASRSAMQAHANKRIDVENKRLEDMHKASMVATPEDRPRSLDPQPHQQKPQHYSRFSDSCSACVDAAPPHFRSAAPSHAPHVGAAAHCERYAVRLLLILGRRASPEIRADVVQHQQPSPLNAMDESRQHPASSEPGVHLRAARAVALVHAHSRQQPPAARASPTALYQSARKQRDGPVPVAAPPPSYYEHLEQMPCISQPGASQNAQRVQRFPTAERVGEDTSSATCHRCSRASNQPLLRCTVGLEARDAVVSASDEPVFVSDYHCSHRTCCSPNVCSRANAVLCVLACLCACVQVARSAFELFNTRLPLHCRRLHS